MKCFTSLLKAPLRTGDDNNSNIIETRNHILMIAHNDGLSEYNINTNKWFKLPKNCLSSIINAMRHHPYNINGLNHKRIVYHHGSIYQNTVFIAGWGYIECIHLDTDSITIIQCKRIDPSTTLLVIHGNLNIIGMIGNYVACIINE